MKKLALVLTFVFGVAMIAPAFAQAPVTKKSDAKTECPKDAKACAKEGKACCKAAAEKKEGKACCAKPAEKK